VIIADTSGLLAFFNDREPQNEAVGAVIEASQDPLVVSPFVVAEVDYLVATRIGVRAEIAALRELASGAYLLADFDEGDLHQASTVIERYERLDVGVADASLVVLADRFRTRSILTLDRRHFGVIRPLSGGQFRILPSN
jgi:predicted nucleic acid-binding protein